MRRRSARFPGRSHPHVAPGVGHTRHRSDALRMVPGTNRNASTDGGRDDASRTVADTDRHVARRRTNSGRTRSRAPTVGA